MSFIPSYLQSTVDLLKQAYPDNNIGDDYYPIIKILYNEMSDRNLTIVLSNFLNLPPHEVANDIYTAIQKDIDCIYVKKKLEDSGYDSWLDE